MDNSISTAVGPVRPGDTVFYTPFGGGSRQVVVEYVERDIKNGRPGFDGHVVGGPENGMPVWGYADQVTRVVQGTARIV